MSLTKNVRLLLAGSSFTAAGVAGALLVGSAALLPAAAVAQTCTNATMSGAGPSVNCLVWRPTGNSTVASGISTVTILEAGALVSGSQLQNVTLIEPPTVVTFANPNSVLVNEGYIVVGTRTTETNVADRVDRNEAELRLVGLGEFRHSGVILMGGLNGASGPRVQGVLSERTDRARDDVLSLPGTHWVGEGGLIVFDIDLTGRQTNCVDRSPVPTTVPFAGGDLSAADCVRIVGGSTEGVTNIRLDQMRLGDRGRFNAEGILLVDVAGGESAEGHFVIDPASRNYSPSFGGSLDKGLIQYVLGYDDATQGHRLFGILSGAGQQLPLLASAAHAVWRTSTGSWFERQADLRGNLDDGIGGGVWLRANLEATDRDVMQVSSAAVDFSFDNSHSQSTYAVTGGVDLIRASEGDTAFVVGLMAGYAHSEVEYEASPNLQSFDGWTGGAYASFISGGLFVDAAVNVNNVIMDNDVPVFDFFPAGTILSSRLLSAGAQVEAGWRFPLAGTAFVEPLASVSYVRSTYEDIQIRPDDPGSPGLEVRYDDPTSLRAGVGGRVGMDQDFGVARAQFSGVVRLWNEFEGENAAIIHNIAFPTDPDVTVVDDFSGRITELGVGASVYSPGGAVSGFLNLGGKFGDDYEARTGSVGVRVAW